MENNVGLNDLFQMNASLEIFSGIVILILFVTNVSQRGTKEKMFKWFSILLILDILMMFFDAPIWFLLSKPSLDKVLAIKILTFLSDTMSCLMVVAYAFCLIEYVNKYKKTSKVVGYSVLAVCIVVIVLCFVNIFNEMFIVYDLKGVDHEGKLSLLYNLMFFVPQALNLVYLFVYAKYIGARKTLLLGLFCAMPIIASPLQFFWAVTPVYIATTFSLILCYALFMNEQIKKSAEKDRELLKKEIELMESKNAIFLSQIQPHFLYNSLTSIYSLCESDPEKAKLAIVDFSKYLRANLDSLKQKKLIGFNEELNHIKAYLRLEKLRYDDDLNIIYEIKVDNFLLPVLTVQPLVENAINHGICNTKQGGIINIKTGETEDYYEIRVIDNGAGFYENDLYDPNRTHTGIDNVRSRLKNMCNGTLEIASIIGVGTTAIIKIPKGE